jgi:uncharacterized protein with FMN-binding domain
MMAPWRECERLMTASHPTAAANSSLRPHAHPGHQTVIGATENDEPVERENVNAMTKTALQRIAPAALMTTAAVVQVGGITEPVHASSPAAKSRTFKGPTEVTTHGPVQVSIVVANKKIVNVKTVISPNSDGRSPFLQEGAVPVLKRETLKAQSARISLVSGATETSQALVASLQSAIKKARAAKALK